MRMGLWLALALGLGIAAALGLMGSMPGQTHAGPLPPLADEDRAAAARLRQHVTAIASKEHNFYRAAALEEAARAIEAVLRGLGYRVAQQTLGPEHERVRNIEIEIPGASPAAPIVVVGAHYDSALGAPGANDNGSGVAAVLELARRFVEWRPVHTWRMVLFVNEEMPFFQGELMGSRAYAVRAKARAENIAAMYALETIGYYADAPGTQRYPFPLGFFYPDRGNFLAFVANLRSRGLLRRTIAAFRAHEPFPTEGIAAPELIPGVGWSDHASFWRMGYAAMMITDSALYRYPHYHTADDTPDKVDYERLARVVRGLERAFRALDGTF